MLQFIQIYPKMKPNFDQMCEIKLKKITHLSSKIQNFA